MGTDLTPFENPDALKELLNQPEVKLAELLTGALALGKSEAILVGGRLVQAALKGNLMKQVGQEVNQLIEKGKIKEDYADSKYGFQTLAELLAFIESEAPDKDRFEAVKALFYAQIDKDASLGTEILRYQLFKIATRLNSSQLSTLKAAYRMRQRNETPSATDSWRSAVAREVGHNSVGLIMNDEPTLEKEALIGHATYADGSGISNVQSARLTDLGIQLVEHLTKYEHFAE